MSIRLSDFFFVYFKFEWYRKVNGKWCILNYREKIGGMFFFPFKENMTVTLISEVSTIILIYNLQNNLGAILKPKILWATIYQERVTFI